MLRRRLRCHGCGETSPSERAGVARAWVCMYCEAVNHVDERGNITDPPIELTTRAQPIFTQRTRSPTPDVMSAPIESPFCDRCEKNQLIVNRALAEWLPDEDDPEYAKQEKSLPQYRAQLEEHYPQVCENCIERVQARIRQAGYAAKADAMIRRMEQSRKYQDKAHTSRQLWTLAIVWLGKMVYISSVVALLVWHLFGVMAVFDVADHQFDWFQCLSEAVFMREVDKSCVVSPTARTWVAYALLGDLLTILWNPKLAHKTTHANRRMSGLYTAWIIRAFMLFLNTALWLVLGDSAVRENGIVFEQRTNFFRNTHLALFVIQLLATWISWKAVTIQYISTKELLRPLDQHLPQAPSSRETTPRPKQTTPLPNHTSFDSMAAGFASSFPSQPNKYEPPSPTLTAVSTSTTTDENDWTPWRRKSATFLTGEEMDWTPTKPRFNANPPPILPPRFTPLPPSSTAAATAASPPDATTNIFKTGIDANPFRRRVPAAPKPPAAKVVDPWRRAAWQPDPLERQRNLFEEEKDRNAKLGAGLHGKGVPRAVEREALLFAPPKFKFDAGAYGGSEKETGLEDTFNNLFSK
ncbi:hypothetical protein BU23DRAFT_529357 [Bimuria novae-zelandiae CBS 107.79]|uniref:Ima1 N-terminal domain-containing protein n=1 Tax=Bimuria novae-zelandiae CBS 107.79 TaxID=1447943 RepID=A0A6A5VM80_9PLEO|nr:hypothetical protein BU23DRAFT_529357 [Bimuria novae-zelandiae CBS 107.79]